MRARRGEFSDLELAIKKFFFPEFVDVECRSNQSSENNNNNNNTQSLFESNQAPAPPIFFTISMNRQGKTLFLDTVANDSSFHTKVNAWSGGKLSLVFNVTFNGSFAIIASDNTFTIQDAAVQFLLRLACAVEEIHSTGASAISSLKNLLKLFQRHGLLEVAEFVASLQEAVARRY